MNGLQIGLLAILILTVGLLFIPVLIRVWYLIYDKINEWKEKLTNKNKKMKIEHQDREYEILPSTKNMNKTGVELIADERKRQIEVEGFTSRHDELWLKGQLAMAACCYARPEPKNGENAPLEFPWNPEWWKPCPENRVRELVKAGALIAAEIDRIQNSSKDIV